MLENGVFHHILLNLLRLNLLRERKYCSVNFLEAAKRINRPSFPFRSSKEIFSPRIQPLIWIFSRPASATTTCWWVSEFAVWAFAVFLFHMSIQSWIRQISFVAILALEVSALVVILASSLALSGAISIFTVFRPFGI